MDFLTLQFRNSDKSSITFCVRQQFWGALSSSAYVILSRFNCDCSSATTFYSSFHVWTRCTFEFYKQLLLHLSHFNNQNKIRNIFQSNQISKDCYHLHALCIEDLSIVRIASYESSSTQHLYLYLEGAGGISWRG